MTSHLCMNVLLAYDMKTHLKITTCEDKKIAASKKFHKKVLRKCHELSKNWTPSRVTFLGFAQNFNMTDF